MGLQLVRITKEVTYGVYPTSPATGTQIDIYLPGDDAMTVRTDPKFWMIRDAGAGNRVVKKSIGRKAVGGGISTYLFPSQAPLMLGLLAGLTGTAPCLKLPSFTIDHIVYKDLDCGVIGKRYVGNIFESGTIACDDSDGNGVLTTFKGSIIGSVASDITLTDFPTPSLSAYPADNPYLFFQTAEGSGKLVIDSARHNYKSLSIDIKNMVKAFGGEQRYSQLVGCFGRDVTFATELLLASNADRAAYEAGTKRAVQVEFDDGTHTCLFDFGAQVNMDGVTDKFPLGDYFTQALAFSSLVDPAVGTDLTVTLT